MTAAQDGTAVSPAGGRFTRQMDLVASGTAVLRGQDLAWTQLFGGLAHVTCQVATAAATGTWSSS